MSWITPLLCEAMPETTDGTRARLMREAMECREKIRQMRQSMSWTQMSDALGISRTAVSNHVRAIKEEALRTNILSEGDAGK